MGPPEVLLSLGQVSPKYTQVGVSHEALEGVDVYPVAQASQSKIPAERVQCRRGADASFRSSAANNVAEAGVVQSTAIDGREERLDITNVVSHAKVGNQGTTCFAPKKNGAELVALSMAHHDRPRAHVNVPHVQPYEFTCSEASI